MNYMLWLALIADLRFWAGSRNRALACPTSYYFSIGVVGSRSDQIFRLPLSGIESVAKKSCYYEVTVPDDV